MKAAVAVLAALAASSPVAVRAQDFAPLAPYVARGACPYECCSFGEWTALGPIPVHLSERDREVAYELPAGTTFRALRGNVHVDTIGMLAVVDTMAAFRYSEEDDDWIDVHFETGDTLEILDYLGEGYHHVRHDCTDWTVIEHAWGPSGPDHEPSGVLLREPRAEWWVEIETDEGARGWVEVTSHDMVTGIYGC